MKTWIFLIVYASFAVSAEALANGNSADKSEFNRIYREYKSIADTDDYGRQLVLLEQSLELGKKLFDSPSKSVAALYHSVANLRAKNAQDRKALSAYYSALWQYESIYGKRSEELIDFLLDFGDFSIDPASVRYNESFYKTALQILKDKYGENSIEFAILKIEIGNRKLLNVHSFPRRRLQTAKTDIEHGYKIILGLSSVNEEDLLFANVSLAKLRLNEGRSNEALEMLNTALKLSERTNGDAAESSLTIHGYLANTYSRLGKKDQATEHCRAIATLSPIDVRKEPSPVVIFNSSKSDWSDEVKVPPVGYVDLTFDVDESGFVENIAVLNYEGIEGYVFEAMRLAEHFRYAPAIVDGQFIKTNDVNYRMEFRANPGRANCMAVFSGTKGLESRVCH